MPPRETPIEPGLVARAAGLVRYVVTGQRPEWFGPGSPLAPQAPEEVRGRQWDFPVGYNIVTRPRAELAIGFPQLRALAENHDITRLCIETRKDQLARMPWTIKRLDGRGGDDDATVQRLTAFLRKPDRVHRYARWQRMLVEDMLVCDAATVYVRPTRGGQVYALEPIDGATIKPVLGEDGRVPDPPAPAYQQILKGLPAVDYSRDELLYAVRNDRTHRVYGYSIVEQIVMIVTLALRREVHQLDYYTEGTIPDALATVPASWTAKQIQEFQTYFDLLMAGDSAVRRRLKFLPDSTKVTLTKTAPLFDEGDEWLARVVCYAFSLPPNPFVKQVNRATAETVQEAATEEGLVPIMTWWKDLMDELIQGPLGEPDYAFVWSDAPDVDPLNRAKIDDLNLKNRSKTVNEVRKDRGDPPVPWGDEPVAEQAPRPVPGEVALEGDPAADGSGTGDTGMGDEAAEKSAGRSLRRRRFVL
jgi:hypothetical protein